MHKALQTTEVLLKIIECTDVSTVLTLRRTCKRICSTITAYGPSICQTILGSNGQLRSTPIPTDQTPLQCLKFFSRRSLAQDLAATTVNLESQGIPPDEPWGDELRARAANGLMLAFQFADIAQEMEKEFAAATKALKRNKKWYDPTPIWPGPLLSVEFDCCMICARWEELEKGFSEDDTTDHEIAWLLVEQKLRQREQALRRESFHMKEASLIAGENRKRLLLGYLLRKGPRVVSYLLDDDRNVRRCAWVALRERVRSKSAKARTLEESYWTLKTYRSPMGKSLIECIATFASWRRYKAAPDDFEPMDKEAEVNREFEPISCFCTGTYTG